MKVIISFYLLFLNIFGFYMAAYSSTMQDDNSKSISVKFEAESSIINPQYMEVVNDNRLSQYKGIALKEKASSAIKGERTDPDLFFEITLPQGRYILRTHTFTDCEGAELMKKATSKFESLYTRIQIDNERPTQRVIYVPWDVRTQTLGIFYFKGDKQSLKLWLPKGVRLDYIQIQSYTPPPIPDRVADYIPPYTPPPGRPRLWLNNQSLDIIKERLNKGENKVYWEKLSNKALTPYNIEYEYNKEITYDPELETTARYKAFYYLMTNDKVIGEEAIKLMTGYLSRVEFGNLLDITREIGRAIYSASLVYDWCYELMSTNDRKILFENLIRLAEEMEIGWPPFKQSVLTGHGSEAQIHRDLLAMSIAIYDEAPMPYKYCSYRILEELVPMRNWQYQSPRHNQGVNYGAYRSQWDIHAAWLFYRMAGKEVFDKNLKRFPYYWLYMRLPNGQMLRDGDGFNTGKPEEFYYWKSPETLFLFYTYANDSKLKGEFMRQGGAINDPMLFLLLNDPDLKADENLKDLPLSIDFGPILGSMIARTGWNIGMESDDVVAEIKGGGYHFGNHQHSDAGSLQLFYRGFQVADLGVYGFYGTPYDMNFNKRSISHSMMLAVDPDEFFDNRVTSNDGGTRFNQRHPDSPEVAMNDPWFNNGTVISTDFGPSSKTPRFSYFSVNLKNAYSDKIEDYTRQFCFVNLENDTIPALIVLMDKMITANPNFKKYWQINSHTKPVISNGRFVLENRMRERVGKTYVQLLTPKSGTYSVELLSGRDANSSFGTKYEIPSREMTRNLPETNGHRFMVSPLKPQKSDHFLASFQVVAGDQKPIDISCTETNDNYFLSFEDYLLAINKETELTDSPFPMVVPECGHPTQQVVIMGLKEGLWNISNDPGSVNFDVEVLPDKNTIYFQMTSGTYKITPRK
ncbi:Hypothetical protein PSM36_0316 [Proteiniphilum saccharofermentans]|uniref:Heparin/heparan-sulfate lyase n=1 Tax=Proteiniphilum saccharofermentans TaxID=1642647 RepID=A0A1R3SVZ9_9BACT|nr:hypothetical protein [Proteiniphilum saccharofermentans]SCD19150.1 Hypothetical protein PSM36_0316 [Proteiniphilum saccharofermentans]